MLIKNNILIRVEQNDIKNGVLTIPNNVTTINSFFLKDVNVDKIIFSPHVYSLSPHAFSGSDVKEIVLNNNITNIPENAFFNCKNLKSINLNDYITSIHKHAFYGCKSLESIYIGSSVCEIENGAFACSGIKKFNVSRNNKKFFTDDSKKLLIDRFFNIVSYAVGSNSTSFNMNDYITTYEDKKGIIRPLYKINDEAFKGAINLKELSIVSSITGIGYNSFENCPNLDSLVIIGTDLFTTVGFEINDDGHYFVNDYKKQHFPFKTIKFCGKLYGVLSPILLDCENISNIIIDNNIQNFSISGFAFGNILKNLNELYIPEGVIKIESEVCQHDMLFKFHNGFEHVGKLELSTDQIDNYIYQTITIKKNDKFLFRVYKYKYYISNDTLIDVTILSEDDIKEKVSNNILIFDKDNPSKSSIYKYIDTINKLNKKNLNIPLFRNGVFISFANEKEKNTLIDYLSHSDTFALNIIEKSKILSSPDAYAQVIFSSSNSFNDKNNIYRLIDYIELLRKYNITDEILYDKAFITKANFEEIEYLIANHYEDFINILKTINFNKDKIQMVYNDKFETVYDLILQDNSFKTFIDKLNYYKIKDRFLFDINLIKISSNPLFDNILKYYDGNMKRLLMSSGTLNNNNKIDYQTTLDLLTLMKITGCFNPDKIKRQQNQTFVIEKVFEGYYYNNLPNSKITGNEIHSVFNFTPFDEDIIEFEDFFRENYLELTKLEVMKSGYIRRIYENFKGISNSSSSNKGEQRHLKVTLEKCINYLKNNKFNGIPVGLEELAVLIGEYFDEQKYFDYAVQYINESKMAPRNIFIAPIISGENIIYDNDKKHDLKENVNEYFSYEWLPKQDYSNLILGKYCNCCAHIGGAGAGIMRASMTSDCHQNLVIRNNLGEIVAKSTIYVNKEKGYAVFNTVEASFKIRTSEYHKPLYEALMKATKDFVKVYNENFDKPITKVSIGLNRNYILDTLNDSIHPEISPLYTIPYSKYKDDFYGTYDGDSTKQKILLKI